VRGYLEEEFAAKEKLEIVVKEMARNNYACFY